jgi:hypothetical protein
MGALLKEARQEPAPQEPAQRLTLRHAMVVFTGMFISFAPAAIVFNIWGIFIVPVTGELQVATNQFTFYVAILFIAAAIMAPFMGSLLDRFDLRLVGTASVGICALGVVLGAFYTEVWQFYLSGLMEGIGIIALNFLLIPTLINRWFTANNGLLLGICMSMTGVGGAVWNFVGGLIIGGMGWRAAYLILGVVAATAILATLFCIRSYPADVGLQPYGRVKEVGDVGAEALRRGVHEDVDASLLHGIEQDFLAMRAQALGQMEGPHLVRVVVGGNGNGLVYDTEILVDVDGLGGVVHKRTDNVDIGAHMAVRHELVVAFLLAREVAIGMIRLAQALLLAGLESRRALGEHRQAAGFGHLFQNDHALASTGCGESSRLSGRTRTDNYQIVLSIECHCFLLFQWVFVLPVSTELVRGPSFAGACPRLHRSKGLR